MTDTRSSDLETLVLGVDALSHDVLEHLPDGTTPTIDAILADGASGPLESQLPPWTPSAWPSIYTGVNPGKHGLYGFLRFEGYDWRIANAEDVKAHALWALLSEEGYRSVVVNVPMTHPAREFDGVLIPGYGAPENPECHPRGLLEDVRDEIGEYRLYNRQLVEGATREERVDGYEELIEMRGAAFRYLLEREAPDFGFLQFQQSDTVLHEFPETEDAPRRVYAAIDDEIDRILTAFDPTTVVLVSDHGIGPCDDVEFRPNTYFRDRGLVETSADADKPSWSQLATEQLRGDGDGSETTHSPGIAQRTLSAAASVGLTSQRIGRVLQTLHLDQAVLRVVPSNLVQAASEHVDFPNSTAYMRDRIELGIRINLAGREPEGIVSAGEYEGVRAELIDSLSSLRTPDGDPVFDEVLRREDVFFGPYVDDAPDIVTVPRSFDVYLSASVLDEPFGTPREPWNHKLHGLVAVTGDDVPTTELRGAHLLDVAPSILSLLGVPVSDRMDGAALRVLEETDRRSYPDYEPTDHGDHAEDTSAIEEQLSNLGYLE